MMLNYKGNTVKEYFTSERQMCSSDLKVTKQQILQASTTRREKETRISSFTLHTNTELHIFRSIEGSFFSAINKSTEFSRKSIIKSRSILRAEVKRSSKWSQNGVLFINTHWCKQGA